MCGIFGIVRPAGIPAAWVERLGQLNTARGNIAFGGLVWSPEADHVFRFAQPFEATKIDIGAMLVVLGHIRAPTGGHSNNLGEVHPFEATDLLLAHNGILLNHTDFPQWRSDPTLIVDSQIIIGGIQTYVEAGQSVETAISQTVSQLDGQQGCWLWSKSIPMLYLWRVMSSLYYRYEPGCLVFSSVKCDLADQLLPEGIVYQIDPTANYFLPVAEFEFYSPYKV